MSPGRAAESTHPDVVGVVEASYREAPGAEAWLAALSEAMKAALGESLGVYAFIYDLSDPSGFRVDAVGGTVGFERIDRSFLESLHGVAKVEELSDIYEASQCVCVASATFSERRIEQIYAHSSLVGLDDARDGIGLFCSDPSGLGVCVSALMPTLTQLTPRQVARWERVAAHVSAGLRLRRAARVEEAVLRPDGAVEHAEGEASSRAALTSLREMARAIDRARGPLRAEAPDAAVATWRGLCDGRWSLVDRFDGDGRRYLVARRNDPAGVACEGLTLRERQVVGYAARGQPNKLIAYALGISPPTVAGHLAEAARKLGVRSRLELIRVAMALGAASDPST